MPLPMLTSRTEKYFFLHFFLLSVIYWMQSRTHDYLQLMKLTLITLPCVVITPRTDWIFVFIHTVLSISFYLILLFIYYLYLNTAPRGANHANWCVLMFSICWYSLFHIFSIHYSAFSSTRHWFMKEKPTYIHTYHLAFMF